MSNLSVFEFEGHEVRFVGTVEYPEWVAQDVCNVLGIQNAPQAVADFDEDEKGISTIYTPGGKQEVVTLKEPGLYRLMFKSRKPVAKRFQKWITSEVIPSIRKTGSYTLAQPVPALPPVDITNPRFLQVRQAIALLESLGTFGESERQAISQYVVNFATNPLMAETPPVLEVSVEERLEQLKYGNVPMSKKLDIERDAKKLLSSMHGKSPASKRVLVHGSVRSVEVYNLDELSILDHAIYHVMGVDHERRH